MSEEAETMNESFAKLMKMGLKFNKTELVLLLFHSISTLSEYISC